MFLPGAIFLAAQFLVTLEPKTIRAFDDYLRAVDVKLTARAANPEPLAARPAGVFEINAGLEVKRGLVHDWAAVAFLPGVRRAKAIAVLEDFSRHASIYPEVVEGRLEKRDGTSEVLGIEIFDTSRIIQAGDHVAA